MLRGLDQVHIIDENRKVLFSSTETGYLPVEKKAINMVLNDDKPLKIINAYQNKSAANCHHLVGSPKYYLSVKGYDDSILTL